MSADPLPYDPESPAVPTPSGPSAQQGRPRARAIAERLAGRSAVPRAGAQASSAPAAGAPPAGAATPSPRGDPRAAGPIAPPTQPPSAFESLEALHAHYRGCLNCKLGAGRRKLVFGLGQDRPRLMFIGEGPGADEDQQGLPFVGRAGRLLTALIAALGLAREDVYITNVVKCRPPGNRAPEPDEVAACRPILRRQIELLNPGLIVTLGNVPLKALNPRAGGITRERGTPFLYDRWKVLPTFHPSYLLRQLDAIATCWGDFKRAFALTYGESAADPPPGPGAS
ncbi:MAG: uracil-DNA glycosylase [Candidatus Lambdaproteobacteria bacterium]|nr:uracil-DNA glycosylase [Candidatus Lambdaproteobacteria bacterium]